MATGMPMPQHIDKERLIDNQRVGVHEVQQRLECHRRCLLDHNRLCIGCTAHRHNEAM